MPSLQIVLMDLTSIAQIEGVNSKKPTQNLKYFHTGCFTPASPTILDVDALPLMPTHKLQTNLDDYLYGCPDTECMANKDLYLLAHHLVIIIMCDVMTEFYVVFVLSL